MGNKTEENTTAERSQERIAALQAQLQAHIAKSLHLQSRLSAALDSLETLQYTHDRESAAHREANNLMNTKLAGLAEYTQKVEDERDELRDAVLALVEKVEVSNDYAVWPYSRIRLPDNLEPIKTPPGDAVMAHASQSADARDYGPFVVAALKAELEKERMSHARTHDSAELEIACLRSQLARRDAELQACVAHTDHGALLPGTPGRHRGKPTSKRHTPTSPLTPEETARILSSTNTKNRELELEIKSLASRLETSHRQSRPSTPAKEKASEGIASSPKRRIAEHTTSSPPPNFHTFPPSSPPSPHLAPHARPDTPSPYVMTPLMPVTPKRMHKTSSHTRLAKDITAQLQFNEPAFADFNEEMKKLSHEIDELKKERMHWKEVLATDSEATITVGSVIPTTKAAGGKPQEHEAPVNEIAALRAEFEEFKNATARREAEFEAEIMELRQILVGRQPEPAQSSGETDTLVAIPITASSLPAPHPEQDSCPDVPVQQLVDLAIAESPAGPLTRPVPDINEHPRRSSPMTEAR
ncbi:hypothetical protein NM688_g6599 [Phlebia brevispora]|uniref:Uncharacterized protein n=1 Tax=Phlebia brevispora TaxID=194682 RepID=A0ACC1SE96_9APHY|nr:hypothetical protein NM688_g6599 [Phlebia brevispora]